MGGRAAQEELDGLARDGCTTSNCEDEGEAGPSTAAGAAAGSSVGPMGGVDGWATTAEEEGEGGKEGGGVAVEGVEGGVGVEEVEGLDSLASGGEVPTSKIGSGGTPGQVVTGC